MRNEAISYRRTKLACYAAYFTMSSVFCLPPLLFVTLRQTYGISYTLLGTLVLVNFCTQLAVDLLFSAFSRHFDICKIVKIMPLMTSSGLALYALIPTFFPHIAYAGLLCGTFVFSIAAGLSEVLLSPIIAAIPSQNPQRDMSTLHSLYAFGVFFVAVTSTCFLRIFGAQRWMILTLLFALLPVVASVLFMGSPMPQMQTQPHHDDATHLRNKTTCLILCIACIFFGSCAENAMSNWISSFMEKSLCIDKAIGDILGMAMFAALLGLARIAYARYGRNIARTLLVGMAGAVVCYVAAALSSNLFVSFLACILTGMFTAMLWPGTLILMEERIPNAGVAAYALMAAGGDLGASVSPQLMGIIIDRVSVCAFAQELSVAVRLSAEQIGLRASMLAAAVFPLLGVLVVLMLIKQGEKQGRGAC